MIITGPSVFRSEGERAAWLLLCAYLHYLDDNVSGVDQCLFLAVDAISERPRFTDRRIGVQPWGQS